MQASPYARYDTATDLLPLAQELREQVNHGDWRGAAALAELQDECFSYMRSRGDRSAVPREAQRRNPAIKPWVDAMLARTTSRCQRFTPADLEPWQRMQDRVAEAARQGDAEAKARVLDRTMRLDQIPDDTLAGTVKDIIASGDPAAFVDLSAVMGARMDGREKLFDVPAGNEVAGYAYLLAACRLGLDCGPDSRILANLCFNGGGCGYPSIQALLQDTMLTPEQFRAAQAYVPQILAKVPHR
jgi:hypothetical protein